MSPWANNCLTHRNKDSLPFRRRTGVKSVTDLPVEAWYPYLHCSGLDHSGTGQMAIGIGRRQFISALSGAAVAWPLASRAQQPAMSRIGVVMGYAETDPAAQAQVAALRQELHKLGWVEGRNIQIDVRYVTDDPNQIRALAVEMMGSKPDMMVANTNIVTTILQSEVRTVPLVFIGVGDPIGSGFVTNNSHPTANITGFANWEGSIGSKWLETLKEIAPYVEHVGFILYPETPANVAFLKSAEAAAPSLNVKLTALGVHSADEIERSLSAFSSEPNGGLIIAPHAVTQVNRDLIVELAARYRLPASYPFAFYPKAGGLVSYGFDPIDQFQRGASYIDRILKGAKISELPVQYPTKFQLVVNLKTAKALGLTIPESFLLRADEVIE
jgi:putative ABC transport system substrate-binding protein